MSTQSKNLKPEAHVSGLWLVERVAEVFRTNDRKKVKQILYNPGLLCTVNWKLLYIRYRSLAEASLDFLGASYFIQFWKIWEIFTF